MYKLQQQNNQTAVQITSKNHQSAVQRQKMRISVPQEPTGETDRSTFFHSKIIKKNHQNNGIIHYVVLINQYIINIQREQLSKI